MKAPQFIYQFIYQKHINWVLRNLTYALRFVLPKPLRLPPSGIVNLKTTSGGLKLKTNQTSYLTQLLFWNGYKSFEYSEIFEELSKNINTFLDIGANIGYYSLLAAKSNPKIRAYAFEPALGPKYFLNENITLNHLDNNITAVDLALSNTTGHIEFFEVANKKYKYLKYNLAGEGNAGTKTTSRNFIKNSVRTTTLGNFLTTHHIEKIDLIKIDTEGTEIDILNSAKTHIKTLQPIVICETLYNTIETELDSFFNDLNFSFYNHTALGLKKVNSIKRNSDDHVRNCFFVPESKTHLISKFVIS
jgi:FkbM family methyltransferase